MCQIVSRSFKQEATEQNNEQNFNLEKIQTNQNKKFVKFDDLKINFLTFQDLDSPCLTSFFENESDKPKSIKNFLRTKVQKQLLFIKKYVEETVSCKEMIVTLFNKDFNQFKTNMQNQDSIKFKQDFEDILIEKVDPKKILIIYERIIAKIPIIIMGETGIGKKALMKFLTLSMDGIFRSKLIHTGVTEKQIIDLVISLEKESENYPSKKLILFFDEANTNVLISGLFKEIIVDRCIKGRKLHKNIVPVAAINPYKLKSEEQKKIFDCQIQGGIKSDLDNKFKVSDLEYNVFPIHQSMDTYCINFGELNKNNEKELIKRKIEILTSELESSSQKIDKKHKENFIQMVVIKSQNFVREVMGNRESACSLRDINRFVDFVKNSKQFLERATQNSEEKLQILPNQIIYYSFYLSFYVNYCMLIPQSQNREKYLEELSQQLGFDQLKKFIDQVENFFITQLKLPKNIAKNSSLKQNAFILFFCIINKVPLCLGLLEVQRLLLCSFQYLICKENLLKNYPALIPINYQGHTQSKSERILEVFEDGEKRQEEFDLKDRDKQNENLCVICFDEIGLAEISPHNPLKVLHEALEEEKQHLFLFLIGLWMPLK